MDPEVRKRNMLIAGAAAVVLFFCIGSVTISAAIGYYFFTPSSESSGPVVINVPAATSESKVPEPTPLDPNQKPSPEKATPVPPGAADPIPDQGVAEFFTAQQLSEIIVPTRDLRELALRLRPGVEEIPEVVDGNPAEYEIGDRIEFWASNVDDNRQFKIEAELVHKSDVAYAWVEAGERHDAERIIASVDRFSQESYPVIRSFFGEEWSPGIDGDPRLHILHANDLGNSIAGYYSSADEFSQLANEFSNEKEMFYISLEWLNGVRDYEYYETVLAHEFQHMVHWYNDRNEETWVNEGMSELAQEVAGFPPDTGFAAVYASVPDTQLNTWSDNPSGNGEHYGSAYLFMAYFLQRFGDELTRAVVAHPANGIAGFDEALAESGSELRFNDIFADWLVANWLDEPEALDRSGVFGYRQLRAPRPDLERSHRRFPVDQRNTDVRNYGADYIALEGSGDITLHFEGETESRLANVAPYSGDRMWWGNRADDSDSRLTRRFDFSDVAPGEAIEMSATMWYDIEDDYDYGYVLASQDGERWQILPGQRTTTENPSGNSFGHAYTAESTGAAGSLLPEWVVERFDLSDYAGGEIFLRFEYVTDDAVNYPGWFVDDISIGAIDYFSDFENGDDGWESEGWILTDNRLPQEWLIQVLALENGELTGIQRVPVDEAGSAVVEINGLGGANEAILIVSGLTPVTTEPANYTYWIESQ